MLLFFIKIYRTFRRALAQRKYPHQLAWAVAFGVMLGIIPHGNLIAVATVVLILCLRLNHAAMGLTALGFTFLAPRLDPASHKVGEFVLENDQIRQALTEAWQWPLVPWTDINNTIVMGSLVIGLASLVPIFLLTFPLFRMIAPKSEIAQAEPVESSEAQSASTLDQPQIQSKVVDDLGIDQSRADIAPDPRLPSSGRQPAKIEFYEIRPDDAEPIAAKHFADAPGVIAEPATPTQTRIDVVRINQTTLPTPHTRPQSGTKVSVNEQTPTPDHTSDSATMDEALNYLLRQLRDKTSSHRHGDAA